MVIEVTFGSQGAASQIRENPQYRGFLHESDDGRQRTVKLKEGTPERALNEITAEAADSKKQEAEKAGQVELTRKEREEIDFAQPGVNVPKVRSIKGIATNEGVSDYLSFADLTLTVDENRQILKEAAKEEKGRRGLGQSETSDAMIDKRLAQAGNRQKAEQLDQAKDFALIDTDPEAQDFVTDQLGGIGGFDIAFNRREGRIRGTGQDFERLEERHEQRSQRAQTMDEKRSAPVTRDPVEWSNNPSTYDYPGIDTVDPFALHEQRPEQAQEVDENERAPIANSKEQWAMNPDQYDWPGVDTPQNEPSEPAPNPGLSRPAMDGPTDNPLPFDPAEKDTEELERLSDFYSRNVDQEVGANRGDGGIGPSGFAQEMSEKQVAIQRELEERMQF